MKSIIPAEETREKIRDWKCQKPIIQLKMKCWHSESTGTGKNRRTKIVVTHEETITFEYGEWFDQSPDECALDYLQHYYMTRVYFKIEVEMSAEL